MKTKVYIIAEAGVNHNGDIDVALKLIDAAKDAGADCVKFQTFKAEQIVTEHSPKATYQLEVTDQKESQFDMLKKLELNMDDYKILMQICKDREIYFLSTPYNKEDIDFLDKIGVDGYKIASGQLTEIPLLRYAARKRKTMIISTGMSTMSDVFNAVESIKAEDNNDIIVLQCTTNYPSKVEDANLLAMLSIKEACKVRIGYSDHIENNYACFASVALGAEIVEKHFTLDKNMVGPDHSSSLMPQEFKELVNGIRDIEKAIGSGIKKPTDSELDNVYGMRRSLVLLHNVEAGTILTEDMIGFKRTFNGLHVNMLDIIIGKPLIKSMKKDEALQYDSIAW